MNATASSTFEFVRQLGEELAGKDFDLPPFPDTAMRIQEALNDPNMSIDTLSDIIISEPLLMARLLRLANSALLRGSMEVTDIKMAISRIGLEMVRNVAVSFAAKEAFKAPEGSTLQDRLESVRKHSVKVSVLAYFLGRKVKFVGKPDEAMLAGLLHAVGKFYILTRVDQYPELFADEEALDSLLSQWHSGVGRAIVESWGFSENIAEAVDEHELTEREEFLSADVTDLVLVANLLAHDFSDGDQPDALEGLPSLSRMKIDAATLRGLLRDSEEQIRSMTQAMTG